MVALLNGIAAKPAVGANAAPKRAASTHRVPAPRVTLAVFGTGVPNGVST
jgi:hypothetical protein